MVYKLQEPITPRYLMMRYCLAICVIVATITAGCMGHVERTPNQAVVLPVTSTTRAFEGVWGVKGNERLKITLVDEEIVINSPEVEEYWIELTNAKIEDDAIHFVLKHFYRKEEFSPFNGVACNCSIRLFESDKLEYQFSTELTDVETEVLEKME